MEQSTLSLKIKMTLGVCLVVACLTAVLALFPLQPAAPGGGLAVQQAVTLSPLAAVAAMSVAIALCVSIIGYYLKRLAVQPRGPAFPGRGAAGRSSSGNAAGAGTLLVRAFNGMVQEVEAEEQTSMMHLAVEQSPVSIVITDRAGTIEYVNPKFTQLTGFSSAEAVGQNSRILKTGETPDSLYRQLWEKISAGGEWYGEILNKKKSGEVFWESVRVSPIKTPGGKITHYLAVKEDITARKALEQELTRARDAAEAADRLKSEFLANMSHEIRTPMNGVLGMSELLSDTDLTGEQGEYVHALTMSAESLMRVIKDILDFSRIEACELELEHVAFELRASLENIQRTLAARASGKGLALDFRIPPEVPDALVGDPGRLVQVVVNLVSNAVKFTECGEVVLSVTSEKASETEVSVHFSVTDTGIGIPAEMQTMVFDPFSQADASATRKYGGTGLGLTISARLVEMMGGTLRVESEPGQGSSFHFTLRLALQGGPPGAGAPGKPDSPRPVGVARPGAAHAELFDRKETLARMDGDWELFREVVGIFANDSRVMMTEIAVAIDAGDAHGLSRAAHTLKGAILNFSARVPYEMALQLEELGKKGEITGAGGRFAALEAELDRLREALGVCAEGMGK